MSKKQKNYPVTKSEEWLFSILDGAKLAAAPVTIHLSSSAVSCLIGIGKDHTAEILIDKETLGVLESRNVEYKRQMAAEALACEAAGPVALTPVGEAVQKLIPEGGWAAPRQPFLVGPTSVDSHATRTCHALAAILECLPHSEYATSLSASAWELLHQIGRYEDGFEMGEEGGQQLRSSGGHRSGVEEQERWE